MADTDPYDDIPDATDKYTVFPEGLQERFTALEKEGKKAIESIWAYENIKDELHRRNQAKNHGKINEETINSLSIQWAVKYGKSGQFNEQGYKEQLEAAITSFKEIADVLETVDHEAHKDQYNVEY